MSTRRPSYRKEDDIIQIPPENGQKSTIDYNVPPNPLKKTLLCLTSKIFIASVALISVIISVVCISLLASYERNSDFVNIAQYKDIQLPPEQQVWFDKGMDELKEALHVRPNAKPAKNVILFVGDGMGTNTVTAARIYKGGEGHTLSWEKFPHMGLLKTYCADKQVPDSFATGTALFSGVKANYHTGGVDSSVNEDDCFASLEESTHAHSIIKWAQDAGMRTGFVTTTRVTHATPAALYAHVPNRKWECESTLSEEALDDDCKDIARIMVEDEPGKNINVIMGGGRQCLVSDVTDSPEDPVDTWSCYSTDGRDLIADWKTDKQSRNLRHAVVSNNDDLSKLDTSVDYVLGIFANGHLKYEHERDSGPAGMPSLTDMTLKAIEVLKRKKNKGFLLVVEGGNIDQAHHRGAARKALSETVAMDDAVSATLEAMKGSLDNTLIIVTSDHSHTLSINGYPQRGNNILGIASNSKTEGTPYTTLTYATGYKGFQVDMTNPSQPKRKDPSLEDTTSFDYVQQTAINTDENTHGGSDVAVYATGPMAYLFHRVHEQSYVAHAISYALHIGRFGSGSAL